jgi:hypothetical protein
MQGMKLIQSRGSVHTSMARSSTSIWELIIWSSAIREPSHHPRDQLGQQPSRPSARPDDPGSHRHETGHCGCRQRVGRDFGTLEAAGRNDSWERWTQGFLLDMNPKDVALKRLNSVSMTEVLIRGSNMSCLLPEDAHLISPSLLHKHLVGR